MNIHYLELFYYVARFGGIGAAVRHIPYGIQQPAVSGQVIHLEEDLGLTLFQRRPFQLTPAGEELYQFIRPFFDQLDTVAEKLRGGATQLIRVAAASIVLREYLPLPLRHLRAKFPRLKCHLIEGLQPEMEGWLLRQEADLAVTVLASRPPPGLKSERLLELPLVLLVASGNPLQSADELWPRDRLAETLISLPAHESVARHFRQGLEKLGVEWPAGIEVSSLELIETYVAGGFGIGVSVAVPGRKFPSGVRALLLPGFPPVVIGALWHGRLNPVTQALFMELKRTAGTLVAPGTLAGG